MNISNQIKTFSGILTFQQIFMIFMMSFIALPFSVTLSQGLGLGFVFILLAISTLTFAAISAKNNKDNISISKKFLETKKHKAFIPQIIFAITVLFIIFDQTMFSFIALSLWTSCMLLNYKIFNFENKQERLHLLIMNSLSVITLITFYIVTYLNNSIQVEILILSSLFLFFTNLKAITSINK